MGDKRTIVVVGGVAGGASAAARARRVNEQANIILLEKDQYVSFANCGLPYYLGGQITDRNKLIVARPERFKNWLNIEVRTRHQVIGIDRPRKLVKVLERDTGREYEQGYDKLVLSPGAEPIQPKVPGFNASNVYTLRNLADTDRIKQFLVERKPSKAVVVGAGFIGLEMVEMLRELGMSVALVEMAPQVLPPLDEEMAHMVQAELEKHGVAVHLGNALAGFAITGEQATAVQVADGTTIPCDLAIVGAGVRPSVQLAQQAGLDIGSTGGVKVNRHMQTSDPSIYAVGDAVEYLHGIMKRDLRVPMAGPANRAGRVAGEHAAADDGPMMPVVMGTAIVRVFAVTAGLTGLSSRIAKKENIAHQAVWVTGNHHAGYYPGAQEMMVKLLYAPEDGRILGAQVVGGAGVDKRLDVIATAMHYGGKVDDLTQLDLAYAPPFGSAKDPVHMAGFVAQNALRKLDAHAAPTWPHDLSDDQKQSLQIVDVRTAAEWNAGHLDGAVWIPLDELRQRVHELDPSKTTLTVCRGGQRAYYAGRILRQNGFKDVRTLAGGMLMQQHVTMKKERVQS